jgi:hypothetical protein
VGADSLVELNTPCLVVKSWIAERTRMLIADLLPKYVALMVVYADFESIIQVMMHILQSWCSDAIYTNACVDSSLIFEF